MIISEQTFEVNGLSFAALKWENRSEQVSQKKVLCLHGWLDNAASFMALAPLLDAHEVVAIDFAGHGRSAHRHLDASYNIWEDLEDILGIAQALGWNSFNLVGHSRGGTIAVQLAAVMPGVVEKLVLIDAIFFHHESVAYVPQLRQYLSDRKRYTTRKHLPIDSVEKALEQRLKATQLEADEAVELVRRNLVHRDDGKYNWSYDNRLRGASAVKLLDSHVESILESLTVSTLMLSAEKGSYAAAMLKPQIDKMADHDFIDLIILPGGHHLHMQKEHVDTVAGLVNDWIS